MSNLNNGIKLTVLVEHVSTVNDLVGEGTAVLRGVGVGNYESTGGCTVRIGNELKLKLENNEGKAILAAKTVCILGITYGLVGSVGSLGLIAANTALNYGVDYVVIASLNSTEEECNALACREVKLEGEAVGVTVEVDVRRIPVLHCCLVTDTKTCGNVEGVLTCNGRGKGVGVVIAVGFNYGKGKLLAVYGHVVTLVACLTLGEAYGDGVGSVFPVRMGVSEAVNITCGNVDLVRDLTGKVSVIVVITELVGNAVVDLIVSLIKGKNESTVCGSGVVVVKAVVEDVGSVKNVTCEYLNRILGCTGSGNDRDIEGNLCRKSAVRLYCEVKGSACLNCNLSYLLIGHGKAVLRSTVEKSTSLITGEGEDKSLVAV